MCAVPHVINMFVTMAPSPDRFVLQPHPPPSSDFSSIGLSSPDSHLIWFTLQSVSISKNECEQMGVGFGFGRQPTY